MVRFHNGTPVGVYYSQHVDGVGFKWDSSKINITDGRVRELEPLLQLRDVH